MIHKTKFFAALALVGVVASIASAGQVAVIPTVTARFDNATDFNPLSFTSPGAGPITDGPGLYQIDLSIHTTNLAAGERGFASLAFDVVLGANQTVGFDYQADPSQVDSNGAAPGGLVAKWTTNQDAGAPGDYQGMLLAGPGALNANPDVDPRGTLGDPDPEFFGSIFVNVTGNGTLGFGGYEYSLRDSTTGQFLAPISGASIPSIVFGTVDEVLPVVGNLDLATSFFEETLVGVVPLTDVDDLDFDAIAAPGFVPTIPGKPLTLGFLPTLDDAGNFSWNTAGSLRGTYTWAITGTNPDGSDGGLITVQVNHVPEPATFAMLGLAAVGLVGCIRRRS